MKNINRRTFLKNTVLTGVAGIATGAPTMNAMGASKTNAASKDEPAVSFPDMKYNANGKFKILQITDTHIIAGDQRSQRALDNINQMIELEKPDLVIHTGDIIHKAPAEDGARMIYDIIKKHNVPFAIALGNHDEDGGKTADEMLDIARSYPNNLNVKLSGMFGATNGIITLTSPKDNKIRRVFYLFDSGRGCTLEGIKGYGFIHFDQIAWYRKRSAEYTKLNDGTPIPSFAFFHIPVPEFEHGLRYDENRAFKGNLGENPCPPPVNSGLFVSMKELKDIDAIFCGHEHNNDYVMYWNKMLLFYGRFSGGDTVYNDLKPCGARVIELTDGEDGFRSWIRTFGGGTEQVLKYPDAFINK